MRVARRGVAAVAPRRGAGGARASVATHGARDFSRVRRAWRHEKGTSRAVGVPPRRGGFRGTRSGGSRRPVGTQSPIRLGGVQATGCVFPHAARRAPHASRAPVRAPRGGASHGGRRRDCARRLRGQRGEPRGRRKGGGVFETAAASSRAAPSAVRAGRRFREDHPVGNVAGHVRRLLERDGIVGILVPRVFVRRARIVRRCRPEEEPIGASERRKKRDVVRVSRVRVRRRDRAGRRAPGRVRVLPRRRRARRAPYRRRAVRG